MAKQVNYTNEQTSQLVEAYQAAETAEARTIVVQTFAETLGKTVASVRAKLAREGVYIAKAKTAKGSGRVTKADIVSLIASRCGVPEEELDSLAGATRDALTILVNSLDTED